MLATYPHVGVLIVALLLSKLLPRLVLAVESHPFDDWKDSLLSQMLFVESHPFDDREHSLLSMARWLVSFPPT